LEEEITVATPEIVFDRYTDIRDAMYHADLSRTFDPRSFEEGNPRAGILSVLHGDEHKGRRRLENPLFRRAALVEYERDLFPQVVEDICARSAVGAVDLFHLSGEMAVVLAARRVGLDHDGSPERLSELWRMALMFSQAAGVLDLVGDKDKVQAEASRVLHEFDQKYVTPSRLRRAALLDAIERGETDEEAPHDLITVVLRRRRQGEGSLDDGLLVREAALYLHGGSQTSSQTTCNAFYFLLGLDGSQRDATLLHRVGADPLLAQRAVHETLRLRPATPQIKRRATADVVIGGVDIPAGSTVVLDIATANRDPEIFGERPEDFNPERIVAEGAPMWGQSFGAGSHICIGRSVAGGFPLQGAVLRDGVGEEHLYGLVAQMVRAIAARAVQVDPDRPPTQDGRSSRGRWLHFPVLFPPDGAGRADTQLAAEARA